jgi:hypothetical protein
MWIISTLFPVLRCRGESSFYDPDPLGFCGREFSLYNPISWTSLWYLSVCFWYPGLPYSGESLCMILIPCASLWRRISLHDPDTMCFSIEVSLSAWSCYPVLLYRGESLCMILLPCASLWRWISLHDPVTLCFSMEVNLSAWSWYPVLLYGGESLCMTLIPCASLWRWISLHDPDTLCFSMEVNLSAWPWSPTYMGANNSAWPISLCGTFGSEFYLADPYIWIWIFPALSRPS